MTQKGQVTRLISNINFTVINLVTCACQMNIIVVLNILSIAIYVYVSYRLCQQALAIYYLIL